jgi:hypothetical protein
MWLNTLGGGNAPHRQRANYRQPFRGKADLLMNNSNRGQNSTRDAERSVQYCSQAAPFPAPLSEVLTGRMTGTHP